MLPAQRGDVGEQHVGYIGARRPQVTDGPVEVNGIPERDCGRDQGQPGSAVPLVLEGAVAQFAKPVEEDGAGESVAGFTLVEDAARAASLLGIVEPVEHEQRALDAPDLA